MIGGFNSAEDVALLGGFVEPYFAAVDEVWRTRTAEMAQSIVVGLYPTLQVSSALVERTDAHLSRGDVPPALRRLLLEGRDGVVRALKARERDAAAG